MSRFGLGLLSAPTFAGTTVAICVPISVRAAFVFVLLHRRGAIATEKVPTIEEFHETLVLWVGLSQERPSCCASCWNFLRVSSTVSAICGGRFAAAVSKGSRTSSRFSRNSWTASNCSKNMDQVRLLARLSALALAKSFLWPSRVKGKAASVMS